jgi:signal transduction histidine kinase
MASVGDGSEVSQTPQSGALPSATSRRARFVRFALWSFLFWTALGIFFAAQLHFAGLAWGAAFEWSLPRWYTWGLLTPAVFWLDRRLIDKLALGWRIALHAPLAIAWTSFAILLRLAIRPLRGAALPTDFAAFYLERFSADVVIYAAIACVSLVLAYTERVKDRERQARDLAMSLEQRLVEARLQNLRAQLQPHFLFNALNTISAFTESDPPLARRLMGQLGDLLRASLAHTSQPLVTLGEELTFLDDYLGIESARFEDRITVDVTADEDAADVRVPSFLLQPLVENAIRHGVGPRASGGRIEVSASREGQNLILRVRDNGLGLPVDWDIDRSAGVGLSNLRARLAHFYGRDDLLRIGGIATGGVDAQVTIPVVPPSGWSPASGRGAPPARLNTGAQ